MTTREDIDQAIAAIEPLLKAKWSALSYLMEAARRGRLLFPSICQTCGGSGTVHVVQRGTGFSMDPLASMTVSESERTCPSCGGSGKGWPEKVVERIAAAMSPGPDHRPTDYERGLVPAVLAALVALAEDNK